MFYSVFALSRSRDILEKVGPSYTQPLHDAGGDRLAHGGLAREGYPEDVEVPFSESPANARHTKRNGF